MEKLSLLNILNSILPTLMIFISVFIGNYCHDEYMILGKKTKKKINLKFIFITSLVITIFLSVINRYIFKFDLSQGLLGISFLFGLLAQQITPYLMSIEGWIKIYKTYKAGKSIEELENIKKGNENKKDDKNK